ncbi:hypothetical protein GCM10025298_06000 [Natronobiforma cellulositropha]
MTPPETLGGTPGQHYCHDAVVPAREPALAWSRSDFEVTAAPFVADGRLYVSLDGAFLALDAASGDVRYKVTMPGRSTPPAVLEETLVVGGYGIDNYLYALERETGEERWRYRCGASNAGVHRAPVVSEGRAIFAAGRTVRAVEVETGERLWSCSLGGRTSHYPVSVADGLVVASRDDGYDNQWLVAIDADTGEERWTVSTPGLLSPTPVVAGAVWYVDREQTLHARTLDGEAYLTVSLGEGDLRWRAHLASDGERLLVAVGTRLAALDLSTFQWDWVVASSGLLGQPIVTPEWVYVATCSHRLYGLDRHSGETHFDVDTGVRSRYACGVGDRRVYVAGSMAEHELLAYGDGR